MTPQEVLKRGDKILKAAGAEVFHPARPSDYARYFQSVSAALHELPLRFKERTVWLRDWVVEFAKVKDNFERLIQADPMILYRPAHSVSEAFHKSKAFIRWFCAGNRTSKTMSGYAEHYFAATRQHPYNHYINTKPNASFIVGLSYQTYAPTVFERKFLEGEDSNPLTPIFPEGGKWLHSYDKRKHILTIACPGCAALGKARRCDHPKSTVVLISDRGGWEMLQGSQFQLGHFDEHINEGFFSEVLQRLAAVKNSQLLITGTPKFGTEMWEIQRLEPIINGDQINNRRSLEDPNSPPYLEKFTIDQFSAGLVPEERIRADMKTYDEVETEAIVYGRAAPLAKNPVFNRRMLIAMRDSAATPEYVVLGSKGKLEETFDPELITVTGVDPAPKWTGMRVWERPMEHHRYIMGVDAAKGFTDRDASCASVFRVIDSGPTLNFKLVAQYHGWLNLLDYADEVFKSGIWYNHALVVVERTGGYGEAVLLRLKNQLAYPNLYREIPKAVSASVDPGQFFGIDTNTATKPYMISLSQQLINGGKVEIPCRDTLAELMLYEQESKTSLGQKLQQPRYQGGQGSRDDRTMSVIMALAVGSSNPIFYTLKRKASPIASATEQFWKVWREEWKDDQSML